MYDCIVFDGFQRTTAMDISIETVVGGAVALECDFSASNPSPVVQWFADGSTRIEEDLDDNSVLYLEGGRFLFIRRLTAAQRMMRYHCEVINENGTSVRAPTTYTLNTDLANAGLTEYRGLGSKVGGIGQQLRFVYAATSRDESGNFEVFAITCPSTLFTTFTVENTYIVTATLTAAAADETEVTITCQLIGSSFLFTPIFGTIIVSRKCSRKLIAYYARLLLGTTHK